ncbi:MAG: AraC family transcriptional regulator [Hespellia sp.]|nr:AraC family transcriptional regulator [Hespellia sp.]
MKTVYTDLNIKFRIGDITFSALNIIYEQFQRKIPKHSHGLDSYEIHYISQGHGTAKIDGKIYHIEPNALYITGPNVEHEQYPEEEDPMTEYCIYLKIKKNRTQHRDQADMPFLNLFEQTYFWYGADTQDIYTPMQQIFYELEHEYTGYITQVETLLQQCIVKIVRNYEIQQRSPVHFAPSNLVDSKYIIVEECFLYEYRDITLQDLSRRLGLSTRQTERFLKENYGMTFLQKKTEAKMSMAAVLLGDLNHSITKVSDDLGYSSLEHFSHAFKKYYGVTARQYRKQL